MSRWPVFGAYINPWKLAHIYFFNEIDGFLLVVGIYGNGCNVRWKYSNMEGDDENYEN